MLKPDSGRPRVAVIALLVVIAACLAWIAQQRGWFERHDLLYVEAPDAAGMTEDMQVTSRGVVVGSVRHIALTSSQESAGHGARIELRIGHEHMQGIPKGSTAKLVRENLIGKQTIDLLPPSGPAQPVVSGDVLAFERGKDRSQQVVEEIQAALMPVIADARKLTDSLNDPEGPFQQSLKAGQEVAEKLPAMAEKTGEVLDQAREGVKSIENGAKATLQKAGRTIDVVQEAAPAVIERVQQAAATSQKASADVQAMAAQAAERLPAVLDQVQAVATQANQMVSNARQTWPISMLTGTATTPQSLPIDSIGGLPLPGETR
ncbi:MlaD family protein [Variovorax rhizosphaerae]|uniref:MlaD family protein n=1 Tax=Variovorax rhizosphaerae TaxID=1836200 RepID=A0ABU8WEX4_9BURK